MNPVPSPLAENQHEAGETAPFTLTDETTKVTVAGLPADVTATVAIVQTNEDVLGSRPERGRPHVAGCHLL